MPDHIIDIAKTFTVKELPNSEIEFSGTLSPEVVAPYTQRALKHITEHLELPGFRKGHVPADMARQRVGDVAVLEEAVELAIQDLYPALVLEHKIDAVGRPEIRILKLAPGNPVDVVAKTAVYPKLELPKNWKTTGEKIALEATIPTTDEEVATTLESLRKSRATKNETGEEVVPELTDEFAQSVGAFADLEGLKIQIKKGMTEEKERAARDKRRGTIIDALLEKVKVAIPNIFVESELDKIISQMREDIARFGMTLEQYLTNTKKTEEAVRGEFRDQAHKRAKLQLTLNKVADEEKLEPDTATVDEEMKHATEHFPDARPDLLRVHIETVLRNEKALQLLEGKTDTETK